MKKKLITFVGIMSLNFSLYANEIQSLSQGSCWVSNKGDHVQVASFNEGLSYNIYRSRLEELVNFLHDNGISPTEVEGIDPYFHCSGMGGRVVFRLKANGVNYCTWSHFDGNKFNFKPLDLADGEEGICDGVVFNKLIVAPADGSSIDNVVQEIEEMGVEVASAEVLFRDLHTITVEKSKMEIFKIRNLLMEKKSARIVDLVTRQHPVGDSVYLESLSFKK
jgi:hypothetical protein